MDGLDADSSISGLIRKQSEAETMLPSKHIKMCTSLLKAELPSQIRLCCCRRACRAWRQTRATMTS